MVRADGTELSALDGLLRDLFDDASSLAAFLRLLLGRDLVNRLPGKNVPLATYALEAAEALEREGLINETLFQSLADRFPHESEAIADVARTFGVEPPRASVRSQPLPAAEGFAQLSMQLADSLMSAPPMPLPGRLPPPSRDVAWARRFLVPGTLPQPREGNPATLLNARYAAVPFHTWLRASELARLQARCEGEAPVAVTVLAGPGGVSKTRLGLAVCDWARERGFAAGLIPHYASREDLDGLLGVRGDVLAIVDYAETRPDIHPWLERAAALALDGPRRLRIVLIVRMLADWWESLLDRSSTELRALLAYDPPIALSPEGLSSETRSRVFAEAAAHFCSLLHGTSPAAAPAELDEPRFGKVLYLHMAALAEVVEHSTPIGALLEDTLRRERQFWSRNLADNVTENDRARRILHELDRGVAAIILAGGARDEDHALALLARAGVSEPLRRPLLTRLGDLYPGTGHPDARDRFLSPLEPDLLAEAHVVAVLLHRSMPTDWLVRLFAGADADAVRPALELLGRLSHAVPEELTHTPAERLDAVLRRALSALIADELGSRAPVALDVAATLAERDVRSPFAEVLVENLRRAGTPALAEELIVRPYSQAVALRPIETWIGETVAAVDTIKPATRFVALMRLGATEVSQENYEVARRQLTEAVTTSSAWLEQDNAAGWMHALGIGLLGVTEGESGDVELSLASARESVRRCEMLEREVLDQHEDLVLLLRVMFGLALMRSGARAEAVSELSALVPRFERVTKGRGNLAPAQAACDLVLGICLAESGQREDAAVALRRAVQRERALVVDHRGSELVNLARCLTFLGDVERQLGNRTTSHRIELEAVELWEELQRVDPVSARPGLSRAACALAHAAHAGGDGPAAKTAAIRAVELSRELAEEQPGPFAPLLVDALSTLGAVLGEPSDRTMARDAFAEAIERARPLAERSPATFGQIFARIHMLRALRCAMFDDLDGAVRGLVDCIAVYRGLPEGLAAGCAAERAAAAVVLGSVYFGRDEPSEAVAALSDAFERLDLVPAGAGPFVAFLRGFGLFVRAVAHAELEQHEAAQSDLAACAEFMRSSHHAFPGGSEIFSLALDGSAVALASRGEYEASEARRLEQIAVLRSLLAAGTSSAGQLADALVSLGSTRLLHDKTDGILELFREAESLLRGLPADALLTRRSELLDCLAALGEIEPDGERRIEYLREAVSLSNEMPDGDTDDLVTHLERLVGLGEELATLECHDEAIAAVQTAITRGLEEAPSPEILVFLVDTLESLDELYVSGGDPEARLRAMRSAAEVWRRLVVYDAEEYRDGLVDVLEQLHSLLTEAGEDDEAERIADERRDLL